MLKVKPRGMRGWKVLLEVVEDNRVFRANDLFIALSRSLFDFKLQKKFFLFFFFFFFNQSIKLPFIWRYSYLVSDKKNFSEFFENYWK